MRARVWILTVVSVAAVLVACRAYTYAGVQTSSGWQNVEILTGISEADMDVFMRAMNVSLGVGCDHCHEPGRWDLDTRAPKETARSMMRMIADLSRTGFEALDVPTCWTCHRGNQAPPENRVPANLSDAYPEAFSSTRDAARSVYENVRQYPDVPAQDLEDIMESYSNALGVGCDYCHVTGNWQSDEKVTKLLARQMFDVQRELNSRFFTATRQIACWTCHQGQPTPAMNVPSDLISIP